MEYNAYRYLWPPRPEQAIPTALLGFYQQRGWVGQVKKNGTCSVVFSHGDEVIFKTRHDDDHKAWQPTEGVASTFTGRPAWNVYVGELLHSKTPHIRNHLYLFDVLVSDGTDLAGMAFDARQEILASRFPALDAAICGVGAVQVAPCVSRAVNYRFNSVREMEKLWGQLRAEDEGLVLKKPDAPLASCVTRIANARWQVKCRKASNKYSF